MGESGRGAWQITCAGSSMFCHAPRRRTSSRRPSTALRVTLSVYTSVSSTISAPSNSSNTSSKLTMPTTS
jgi:hypothetical protein